ncbi:AfsR/SARP family transcriptional regulator [Allorhizocola rhizosphaerae]|uniref:AfsR/SARP family transcriptional regulator n=1 Tax=Allorhizocola rhizosphaerae TaxID=1872709 RepID=UPI000E3CF377|nr:AfsR/SARP family transcriptional regulator [Allorhizocola rhizosphaerae]
MQFRILGPLRVGVDGDDLVIGSMKQRAALATLLAHCNTVVSPQRLVDAMWGADPVPSALKSLHVYIHRLRRAMGAVAGERIQFCQPGYQIGVRPGELDAHRFVSLTEQGRRAMAAGENMRCLTALDKALALWRGTPFADMSEVSPLQPAAVRLAEHRLAALELRVDVRLALGRHSEVIAELFDLACAHPLRERFTAQLMVALYRGGRRADALAAYRRTARILVEELGLVPGPELRRLQQAILRDDSVPVTLLQGR